MPSKAKTARKIAAQAYLLLCDANNTDVSDRVFMAQTVRRYCAETPRCELREAGRGYGRSGTDHEAIAGWLLDYLF